MKVICSMVVTPNGYIARPDGSEEYSSHAGWLEFLETAHKYNNFVIGRKTLDIVEEQYEGFGFADVHCDHKVVVSSQTGLQLNEMYTQATSPQNALEQLRGQVDTVLLVGGSEINSAFAKAGLIDELILTVEPYIIGRGINLFSPNAFDLSLSYRAVEELSGGRLRITYAVNKEDSV